jgi:hypothetical protein
MRFRHPDPAPVLAHLKQNPAAILVREWERERAPGGILGMLSRGKTKAAGPAQPADIADVAFIAGRGHGPAHVGNVLRYFFHVASSTDEPILPLVEAVAHVEARGTEGEFLLAGHPDGGLVSVSRGRLAFQDGLEPITWWGP